MALGTTKGAETTAAGSVCSSELLGGTCLGIMEAIPDAVFAVRQDGRILAANQQAAWWLGWQPGDLEGRPFAGTTLPPQYHSMVERFLAAIAAGREDPLFGKRMEMRAVHRGGHALAAEMVFSPLRNAPGPSLCACMRDLTAQRELEDMQCRLTAQDRLILDSAGEGIFGLDRTGHITFMNRAAERMLGAAPGELVDGEQARDVPYVAPDQSVPSWEEGPVSASLRTGEATRVAEGSFRRRDGTQFPVEFVGSPIVEEGGLGGVVVVFRDLTDERRLQAELMQARSLEFIGSLVGGIAHELDAPIRLVGERVRFLRDRLQALEPALSGIGGAEGAELAACEESMRSAGHAARIVRAMTAFAEPCPAERIPVDLNQVIADIILVSRNTWKSVADTDARLDPGLPPVPCLRGEVIQVLLNLLANAVRAVSDTVSGGGTRGRISVATRLDRDWAEIRVSGACAGMASAPDGAHGTDVARSVIVERHHGSIECETTAGAGTTWIVRLPLRGAAG